MRVAFLSTSYPSFPGDGAGHFVRAEARAAVASGDEVHVVAPRPHAFDHGIAAHPAGGEGLFAWPGAATRARERPGRLWLAPGFGIRAALALGAIRADRVVAHWMVPAAAPIALAAAGSAELHVVCHGADVRLLLALPAPVRRTLVARVVRRATRVRFVAASLLEALGAGLDARGRRALFERAVVARPAVDVSQRHGAPAFLGPYVIAAGRLVASKRVDLAIRAVARCPAPLSLVVLGDGPERRTLCEIAAREADGRVTILGRVSRPDALGWISGAVALLHASSTEAAPTAVLEARALGVPVVACPSGDLIRWARADSGLRIVAPSPGALALALGAIVAASPVNRDAG